MCIYKYIPKYNVYFINTGNKKETMNLKESKERYMIRFGWGKGKEEMI